MSKGSLTFEEKVIAAYLHYVEEVDQHVIAIAFGVNQGRVNEACVTVRDALRPPTMDTVNEIISEVRRDPIDVRRNRYG